MSTGELNRKGENKTCCLDSDPYSLEPGNVVCEHVDRWGAVDDEVGHLAADSAAELNIYGQKAES